jgi:hypothetical protein
VQVARLREALKEVAQVRTDVRAHVDALEQARGELSMDTEPTDFAAVLDDSAAQIADERYLLIHVLKSWARATQSRCSS